SSRAIAAQSRGVSFLSGDGVTRWNGGRGYGLRRLLRRAAPHGRILGLTEPFLHKVSHAVVDIMGDAYPELRQNQKRIAEVILIEEERFAETLEKVLDLLEDSVAELTRGKRQML